MDLSEENLIRLIHRKTSRPLKFSELMKVLQVPEPQRREFRGRIKEMVAEGSLVKLRGGRYGLPDEMNLVTGTIRGHPDGYGFLISEEGDPDLYIGRKRMNGAMHGDRALVRVEEKAHTRWGKPEGRVIRILERNTKTLVGVFEPLGRDGWVVPSDENYFHDIFVPGKNRKEAKPGQVVIVEIDEYPTRHQPPIGHVVEVLGRADDPQVELRTIFHKFGVHQDFPPDVLEEARSVPGRIGPRDRRGRQDLTGWLTFTIDGERAKDFDDAVSLAPHGTGLRLGVHIADVSHYVREDRPLDREAFERGTSIYYPDGVVPMLPFELSNEICSLKPGVERLTLTVLMDFTEKGEMKHFEVFPSIIKSRHRLTYTQVWDLLQHGTRDPALEDTLPVLQAMHRLSRTLRKNRFENGSIDFQIPEADVQMNPDGTVRFIGIAEHNPAHELIEEFMLAANRAVARFLNRKRVPMVHRIHEPPDAEKMLAFQEYLEGLGYRLPSYRHPTSKSLHRLLQKVKGKPEARAINTLLLRAMKKAVYSSKPIGHYALGFEDYTHFTSPIRRYPDLAVHRLVHSFARKKTPSPTERKRLAKIASQVGDQATEREIKAMQVEREVVDLRRAQYMADKIGRVYTGIVSGVTSFGVFVELQEVFVEGLVRVSSLLDDYYLFYEHEHMLKGQHRGRTFRIGDSLRVRVADVDLPRRRINLTLAPK